MEVPWKRARTHREEQRTPSSSSSSAITDLPSHLLMEILVQLPIKTLVTGKCVCKSWLHLIEDPQFSNLRLSRANAEICFQSTVQEKRIIQLYTGNSSFLDFDMKLTTLLQLPKFDYPGFLVFANSCNGLLCYHSHPHDFAFIWNPITSELILVPPPSGITCFRGYGLGFCQKSNRFKLLCVFLRKENGCDDEVVAEICTIEKGCSWKAIGSCPYVDFNYIAPIFFRGALHWVGEDNPCPLFGREYDPISNMLILSFDFEEEVFGSVPLPPHFADFKLIMSKIGVLGGCLFVTEATDQSFNIWLMKEYGVQDSWTQVTPLKCTPLERFYYRWCVPINYLDNGEILMVHTSSYLVMYNPVLKSVRTLHLHQRGQLMVITFNPSLVPLKHSMMGYSVHVQ